MDLGLKNTTAFVAGSSAGLGFSVAERLLTEGCRVAMCSRSDERISAAAARLAEVHDEAEVLPLTCDVTSEADIERAIGETAERFGGLNVLVANAGGPPAGFIDDFDAGAWRDAMELNLISSINLVRHALPHLRESARRDGLARIIFITSVSAKQPIPNLYLSNAARAGVMGFAKSLAEELGKEHITVNSVLPGYTKTDRLADLGTSTSERTGKSIAEVEQDWAAQNAIPRLGEPEEFAAAVAFLASRPAAYITGVALPVDGGRSKHLL